MCGIAGIFKPINKVQIDDLRIMSKKIAHRGPDGEGFWINEPGNVGFAHRRLSIIDLSENASQPMHYLDRYTIIFNGEIYNYIELKDELIKKGYAFSSSSDTEVLMALYAEYHTECLSKIDGMFAFALFDNVEKTLFLARDRFGEKPLFYTIQNGSFYFASEMKALFALGFSRVISTDRMFNFLEYGIVYDDINKDSTFYEKIHQVPPASFLLLKEGKIIKEKKYWGLDNIQIDNTIKFDDAVEKYRFLLKESVNRRLRSDVSVGSSLSGGLDSTAIVLIINSQKQTSQVQKTFSARFANFEMDEGKFMEFAIKHGKGIAPEFVWPTADELLNDLENLIYHQEEPFVSGSMYAQYKVMQLAKDKGITVLLDGQGADEQLGGYIRYYHHYLSSMLTKQPALFFQEKTAFNQINKGLASRYRIPRRLPFWLLKSRILNKPYRYDPDVRSILKEDTLLNSLNPLLRYGDRNSMAFSREVRLPFLSHELVEFTFSLPTSFLLNKGWTKFILRKAVEDIIPSEIAWRKDKIGYQPPQDNWDKRIDFLTRDCRQKGYLQYTDGKKLTSTINDWQWLMLKFYAN
ncbi:MAG: asparagine synthase (glutamine-hydrolyzing) [Chitinophagaceae bacterium]